MEVIFMLSGEVFGVIKGRALSPNANETVSAEVALATASGGTAREVVVFLLYGNALNTNGKVELRVGNTTIVSLSIVNGQERKIEAPFKVELQSGQTLVLRLECTGLTATPRSFEGYAITY